MDNRVFSIIVDAESKEQVESWIDLPTITDPQKLGGCISYFRRYSCQALLSLSMQDDDANEVTKHVKAQKPTITTERFEKALQAISDGKAKKEDLNVFELTEVQTAALKLL